MANVASFKKYTRGSRIITETSAPVYGMSTIQAPIQEGYCHTLVNYDIVKDGSVQPRPGINVDAYTKGYFVQEYVSNVTAQDLCKPIGITQINEKDTRKEYTLFAFKTKIAYAYKGQRVNNAMPYYTGNAGILNNVVQAQTSTEPVLGFEYSSNVSLPNPIYTFGQNGSLYYFDTTQDEQGTKTNLKHFRYDATEEDAVAKAYTIEPKSPAANEVIIGQQTAYNMLKEDPYTFEHHEDASLANKYWTVRGITLKDTDGNLLISPTPWQRVVAELYFNYHSASHGPGTIHAYASVPGYSEPIELPVEMPETYDEANMKDYRVTVPFCFGTNVHLTIKGTHHDADTNVDVVHDLYMYGITYNLDKEPKHMPNVNYDLTTCEGMSYWNTQLVLYKLPEDPTLMFFSMPDDPSYFPYPMNLVKFEEPVLTALPLLDSLIVFTRNKIYQITKQMGTQAALIKTCLQQDMQFTDNDVSFITPVKNMLFFKSGNYFYMVVPNRKTLTGELVVTNVSKNISSILDTYKTYVTDLFEKVYLEKFYTLQEVDGVVQEFPKFELVETHSHLDFEDVHNVLVLKRKENIMQNQASFLHVDLIYNTVTRVWRIHLYDAPAILFCAQKNATNNGKYICIVLKQGNDVGVFDVYNIYDVLFNRAYTQDRFVTEMALEGEPGSPGYFTYSVSPYNNVQYLDSGILELNTNFKKRFREIQIKLTNTSQQNLRLNTGISIDGTNKFEMYRYKLWESREDQNSLTIAYSREELVPGATVLDDWMLDVSQFPPAEHYKVRLPISGKGYTIRFGLRCASAVDYKLLTLSYVYRELNAR